MSDPIGEFTFPGIDAIVSASGTHIVGVRPSTFQIRTTPQNAPTQQVGELRILFGSTRIRFKDCAIVSGSYQFDQSGQTIGMIIHDRRWKWEYSVLDGHYNVRNAKGEIEEPTKKSLRELCEIALKALGEKNYDVKDVTDDEYPEVKWVSANGADELAALESKAECRVVLHLNGRVKLWPIGKGKSLTDKGLIQGGVTLEARAIPSSIQFVGGRTAYSRPFQLEAVGLDIDNVVRPIDDLSYAPRRKNGGRDWREDTPEHLQNFDHEPSTEKGRKIRELALRTVYRWYRIIIPKKGLAVPGRQYSDRDLKQVVKSPREFLDISSSLESSMKIYEDDSGVKRDIPAKIIGQYYAGEPFRNNSEIPDDSYETNYHGLYAGSFQINPDLLIVEFDQPVYRDFSARNWAGGSTSPPRSDGDINSGSIHTAELYLYTTFYLQQTNGKEDRYRRAERIPGSNPNNGVFTIKDDSIFLAVDWTYKRIKRKRSSEAKVVLGEKNTNIDTVRDHAKASIQIAMRKFDRVPGQDKLYNGIVPIDLDGSVIQVQWSKEKNGPCRTRASRNGEFPTPLPTEKQRKKVIEQQRLLNNFGYRQGVHPKDRYQRPRIP